MLRPTSSEVRPSAAYRTGLPTIAEAGLPDFEASVWFGLVAPADTPRAVIEKLAAAANGALKSTTSPPNSRRKGSSRWAARPTSARNSLRARWSNGPPPPRPPG